MNSRGRGPSMSQYPVVNLRFLLPKNIYFAYREMLMKQNKTASLFWVDLLKAEIERNKHKLVSLKSNNHQHQESKNA